MLLIPLPDRAVELAEKADKAGTDFFLIGGSTDIDSRLMDITISRIKESVKLPVIVGGGIRDYAKARSVIDAGADIIVTGTVIEKYENPYMALKDIINAI